MDKQEAIKILKEFHDKSAVFSVRTALETVFPELEESEDEKIREDLIQWINEFPDTIWRGHYKKDIISWLEKQRKPIDDNIITRDDEILQAISIGLTDVVEDAGWSDFGGLPIEDIQEWLKKQGEQRPIIEMKSPEESLGISSKEYNDVVNECLYSESKSTEQTEPKFKVGDWCIDNEDGIIFQIVKVLDNTYTYRTNEGKEYSCTHYSLENDARLWTIQDAKDGDVLACGDKVTDCPFIFHNLTEERKPRSYCGVNTLRHFQVNNENGGSWCELDEVRPSTKEQRDILFQKMKEEGYEWDAEIKELEKVEPADKIGRKFKVGDIVQYITDSTDRRKIVGVDTLCDMYTTDSSPIMFEVEDEWKVVVNAEDIEQNPASEPKFKVGDWVVTSYGKVNQVIAVDKDGDGFTLDDDTYFSGSWKDSYHLWTIKDAKDGDVLADEDNNIGIYRGKVDDVDWHSYIYLGRNNYLYNGGYHIIKNTKPATKEQRDLLFQKMKEAGYEWSEYTHQSKKIENTRPMLSDFFKAEYERGKASSANRQLYNRAILAILSNYVEKYPDIRFGQMLCNLDVNPHFDEESRETYWNLDENINKKS